SVLQGRYRIERRLGEGGMGEVYLGTHLKLQKSVAIKAMLHVSDGNLARQFEMEAQLLAALDHPNLARVTDSFEEAGVSYLVMEYIDGRTLEEVCSTSAQPLSEAQVLRWAADLLAVLAYLHTRQPPVIVRDLKPDNVMLATDNRLRLIDFGLATRLRPGSGTSGLVHGMGTEGYAPLEQYGEGMTDQRSDLYALGATLLYLLTRQVPPAAHLRVSQRRRLPDPRSVNPTVSGRTWEALQALLQINPDDRPIDAMDAARRLGLDGDTPAPPAAAPVAPPDRLLKPPPHSSIPAPPAYDDLKPGAPPRVRPRPRPNAAALPPPPQYDPRFSRGIPSPSLESRAADLTMREITLIALDVDGLSELLAKEESPMEAVRRLEEYRARVRDRATESHLGRLEFLGTRGLVLADQRDVPSPIEACVAAARGMVVDVVTWLGQLTLPRRGHLTLGVAIFSEPVLAPTTLESVEDPALELTGRTVRMLLATALEAGQPLVCNDRVAAWGIPTARVLRTVLVAGRKQPVEIWRVPVSV
ncbi:MAG: protein kinase domain-containing protein, partial [Candidatus Xenobia bacterium]